MQYLFPKIYQEHIWVTNAVVLWHQIPFPFNSSDIIIGHWIDLGHLMAPRLYHWWFVLINIVIDSSHMKNMGKLMLFSYDEIFRWNAWAKGRLPSVKIRFLGWYIHVIMLGWKGGNPTWKNHKKITHANLITITIGHMCNDVALEIRILSSTSTNNLWRISFPINSLTMKL